MFCENSKELFEPFVLRIGSSILPSIGSVGAKSFKFCLKLNYNSCLRKLAPNLATGHPWKTKAAYE